MVISTEIENHDVFRHILTELFDSIREDSKDCKSEQESARVKMMAFADMLAHVAYLKSIPSPAFNSRHQICFYRKLVIIDEQEYFKVPNRSTIAIETIFDILDIKTILYMWKAMLFDCTLVLISTQNSL